MVTSIQQLEKAKVSLEKLEKVFDDVKKKAWMDAALFAALGFSVGTGVTAAGSFFLKRRKSSSKKKDNNKTDMESFFKPLLEATIKTMDEQQQNPDSDKPKMFRDFLTNLSTGMTSAYDQNENLSEDDDYPLEDPEPLYKKNDLHFEEID
jgi:hypothetical protein